MWRGIRETLSAVAFFSVSLSGTIHASESIIYVDALATGAEDGSSWDHACNHLQDALTAASLGEPPVEIRVAQGLYKPDQGASVTPGDREAVFKLLNGVALKGGYAGLACADPNGRDIERYETILSGDLGTNNSECVVTGTLTDVTASIDGFSVIDGIAGMAAYIGNPAIHRVTFRDNEIGLIAHAASPSLTDCTFVENVEAMYAYDCNSVLTRCLFKRNQRGADFLLGDPVLTDCTFTGNQSQALECSGTLELCRCSFNSNGLDTGSLYTIHNDGTLLACQCTFTENSGSFAGVLESYGDTTLVDCQFIDNACPAYLDIGAGAVRTGGYTLTLTRCLFAGNSTRTRLGAGAVCSYGTSMHLSHCIFAGNSGTQGAVGALRTGANATKVSNCTFAGNRGQHGIIDCRSITETPVEISNCIAWNGPTPFTSPGEAPPMVRVSYSNIQGGYEGQGNIDVDPAFVQPGHWADPNDRRVEVGPDDSNAIWVMGDYHLKSQAGHWDEDLEDWVYDHATSPCIDAGDPNGALGNEPFPNGGYPNLGAYGGTTEASRTYFGGPVCETQIAGDINGDCVVDQTDMDILLSHWLTDSSQ